MGIDLTVTGGATPYTYLWSNGSTTQDLTNVAAGTYCVTVSDAAGCTATVCATVQNIGGPTLTTTVANATCGMSNGGVDLTVTGGATPYTYLWSNGSTTQDLTNVAAGTYCVTVSDAAGCTATVCATVQNIGGPTLTTTVTNTTCGASNGGVDLTVTGGATPYTYLWSNGSTTQDLVNVFAGTYCVTVTDAGGCTATVCATVNSINGPDLSTVVVNTSCGGSTGGINLTVTGGTTPYNYLWSNGLTTQDLTNLSAGTYCVTVTDGSGCTATTCATVNNNDGPTLATVVTNATCNAANGGVDLTVNGGTSPFNYLWSNGNTTQDLTNVSAGTYCVTVTDKNGCTATTCATVNAPGGPVLTTSVIHTACGASNGSIDLTVNSGQTPYTYLWSNGSTTQDLTNLAAGTYCVTVTDATGCTATTCATVNSTGGPSLTASLTSPICNESNGAINLTVAGGTMPYTYLWSNGISTEDQSNLAAGTYSVIVTDANNCSAVQSYTLICVPPSGCADFKAIAAQLCAPTCGAINGKIIVQLNGGIPVYNYNWTNITTGTSGNGNSATKPIMITGLASGAYQITITDGQGCTAVATATVGQPTNLVLSALPQCASYCNGQDATITIGIINSTPGYTYQWLNQSTNQSGTGTATTEPFVMTGLSAGKYSVTVTDAAGCTGVITTTIEHLSLLQASATASGVGCSGSTGKITVNVDFGTAAYHYEWWSDATSGAGDSGSTPFMIADLASGAYTVVVTDANGCMDTVKVNVGGNVSGQVYNDFNTDGSMDANEPGLGNVKVYLYACDNPVPVDSALTDVDGYYLFSDLNNYPYRIEFVPTQAWLVPSFAGSGNGSSVQFINGADCGLKAAFYNPDDYCQLDPDVAYAAFTQGLADLADNTAVGLFPYHAVNPDDIFGKVPAKEQVGSVYGLAWDRTNKYLYAGAFLKRHVGLGELGLGGIYRIYYSGVSPVVTPLFQVPNVGICIRPDLANKFMPSMDGDAFAKVGKIGLGDLDISSDNNTLWTVNLNTRKLVRIDNILTANPTSTEISIASAPNCDNGVFRPLGMKVYRNKVYVGGVCTGENNGSGDDLSASIHEYDIATKTWKQVLDLGLTSPEYNHGDVIGNVNANLSQCQEWETWADIYTERNLVANTGSGEPGTIITDGNFEIIGGGLTGAEFRCRGQAMLSDIEFTREGLIIIELMDRTGHQFGYQQYRPTTMQGNPISAASGGDILVAYNDNGNWLLEQNGTIPVVNRTSLYGVGNNEGPAGGEFFFDNTRYLHLDADAGGLVHVPGTNEVLGVVVNPNTSEYTIGGGVAYYNLINGSNTRNDLTLVDPIFNQIGVGKANPVGDLEALCDDAPIQIGNRVWSDKDCDGVQDACEAPIAGVLVSLYSATTGTLLATTVTDSTGEYYFTGLGHPGENWIMTPGYDSLTPGTAYKIVFGFNGTTSQFDKSSGQLTVNNRTYDLTLQDTGEGHYPDFNDSDAGIANDPGKAWHLFPTIMYTTGLAGHTDHTLDAGFCPEPNTLLACELTPGSKSAIFDLTQAKTLVDPAGAYAVSYHSSQVYAETDVAPLSMLHLANHNTIIYARLENLVSGALADVQAITLKVVATPVAHVAQIEVCPNVLDGTAGTFNLADANAQVTGNVSSLMVTYHISNAEAKAGTNPLSAPYISVSKDVWARVENSAGCYDVNIVKLVVLSSPGVVLIPENCSCAGGQTDGLITAIVFNGKAPYTFEWSNGVEQGPSANPMTKLEDLTPGTYTLSLTDASGCAIVESAAVESDLDQQPPQFLVAMPSDMSVDCDDPLSPMLTLNQAQVKDNCTQAQALEIEQSSLSTQGGFEDECEYYSYTITRTWTLTDASKNAATHVQTIHVEDDQAPVAMCTDLEVVLNQDGLAAILATDLDGGSFDHCAPQTALGFTATTTEFSISDLGLNLVTLAVSDPCGNMATCIANVTVQTQLSTPGAAFSIQQTPACNGPYEVKYKDQSIGKPTAWKWTFPGGTPSTSTEQNPTVTYSNEGNYQATLEVTNILGSAYHTKQLAIQARNMPEAEYTYATEPAGIVAFANFSQGADTYTWYFGDGSMSTEVNPQHQYAQSGSYIVLLSATNDCGTSLMEKMVNVEVTTGTDHPQDWLESFALYPNPNTGRFTIEIVGGPEREVACTLYNALGQVVNRTTLDFGSGALKHTFEHQGLAAGVYTLELRSGQKVKLTKVVIHRK
ncbi:MAG: T9SS type A sorting domain-containing protein [Lewinellaceae bacterium]|nr:T9SS type A sorting domain-containing protein [Lewinellaceae bacterium]